LHKQAQDGGPQQNPQDLVLGRRTRLHIGFDVTGIQIRNGHKKTGSREGPQLAKAETNLQIKRQWFKFI